VERREYLISRFHGKQRYLFIESVCNDEETLCKNIALKLKYSPDYTDMKYDQVRSPLHDPSAHAHKLCLRLIALTGRHALGRPPGYKCPSHPCFICPDQVSYVMWLINFQSTITL
jgi:6-phosphofructo-2-kinase